MTSYNYIKYSLKELEMNSSECTPSMNSGQHKKILAFLGSLLIGLLLHLRPNYIHSASNDIHTDGPRATARAKG